jgi:hypothetical protein
MKRLISFGAACLLALALSTPASAGYIATGVAAPSPTPESSAAATATGEENGVGTADQNQTGDTPADLLTEAALSLVGSVLSLL